MDPPDFQNAGTENSGYEGNNGTGHDCLTLWANNSLESNVSIVQPCWNTDTWLTNNLGARQLPLYIAVPMTTVYLLILISGVIGNLSVFVVIIRNSSMHTATNCYLFSLAVADLTVLIFGLPNDLVVFWQQYPWFLGKMACKLRALISEMTNYASVLTIVAFSLERYIAVCHPLLSYTVSGVRRTLKIVALIWTVALLSALPFAIYTDILYVDYPKEAGSHLHGQPILESAFCALSDKDQPKLWHLLELATFIFFIVPMCILCGLYFRIGITMRQSSLDNRRSSQGDSAHHLNETRESSRRTALGMLVAVVIAFFVCWAPFHSQRLLYIYGKDLPYFRDINEIMFFITGCLYYCSSTINPILYNIMSTRYRQAFRETLCCANPRNQSFTNSGTVPSWNIAPRRTMNERQPSFPKKSCTHRQFISVPNQNTHLTDDTELDTYRSNSSSYVRDNHAIAHEDVERQPTLL